MKLKVKLLPNYGADWDPPRYHSEGASGIDLRAAIDRPMVVRASERETIPCGIAVKVPVGYEAQVRGRSGNAYRHGVCVLHGVGTVDSDFRGEMSVPLQNHGGTEFLVRPGDRIAQMVICPVQRVAIEVVGELADTERGEGGFGSTGKD